MDSNPGSVRHPFGAMADPVAGDPHASEPRPSDPHSCDPLAHLTPAQVKVLRGVHSGLLNKQIAFDLGIAEATVKAHMTALMRKLRVRNRTQVALIAQNAVWAHEPDHSEAA